MPVQKEGTVLLKFTVRNTGAGQMEFVSITNNLKSASNCAIENQTGSSQKSVGAVGETNSGKITRKQDPTPGVEFTSMDAIC